MAAKKRTSKSSTVEMKPYGDPIRQAIAKGDLPEMKRLVVSARKWLSAAQDEHSNVRDALSSLEKAITKLSR